MTIASSITQKLYTGIGVGAQFSFPNKVFSASDLTITIYDTSGNTYPFVNFANATLGWSYTVQNVDVDTGCIVVLSNVLTSGWTIDIRSNVPELQSTSVKNQGQFLPELHEEAFDHATRLIQDLLRLTYTYGIHGPDTEIAPWTPLPAIPLRAGTMLTFDGNGLPLCAPQPIAGSITQAIIGALLYPRTLAEIAAGITPSALFYPESDIRRYGASTGSGNNSAAINNALAVSAAGGAAAFVPAGTWTYTSTLNITLSASMYGTGQLSILNANGCAGLTFGAQTTYAASRFVRDVFFSGTNCAAFSGITINFTAASGSRVTGVEFRNVSIENFGTGVFSRGLWDSSFINCWLYNNYQGYNFNGQSIGCSIIGGFCQTGAITGSGTQYALQLSFQTGEQCQALYVNDWDCFGYAYGFSGGPFLDVVLTGSSFNNCTTAGIFAGASSGGFIVRDCWIQTNNAGAATFGIQLSDLGSAAVDKVVLEGNQLVCNLANAGSVGIYIGANQLAVTANNNTVGATSTQWATGIQIVGNNAVSKFNTINASATAVLVNSSSSFVDVGPNYVQAGTQLAFTSLTASNFRYNGSGSFSATLTGFASGGTGTLNWVAHEGMVTIQVPDAGITGPSNATTMTLSNLPQFLWPHSTEDTFAIVFDNGTAALGFVRISTGGVATFFKDFAGTAFTASGTKGLQGGSFTYAYL